MEDLTGKQLGPYQAVAPLRPLAVRITEPLRGMRTLKVAMRRESVASAPSAFQRFKGVAHVRVEWCLDSPSTLRGD